MKLLSTYSIFYMLIIALCITPIIAIKAQQKSSTLIENYHIDKVTDFIATDKLGNLYAINNEEISKYDATGKLLIKNSIKDYGKITYLDATNPLKILVFFKDYSKIIMLDDMLAISSSIVDLNTLNLDQSLFAFTSHDNGIWIYNQRNFELLRLDQNLAITNQTGNITQLLGIALNPIGMFESENQVYVCDTTIGFIVFDIYGTYIKTIPIKNAILTQAENKQLYYLNKDKFGGFDIETLQQNESNLPVDNVLQIRLQKSRVFIRLKEKIIVYEVK